MHESGLRIPDDISVVSFDDNMLFNYLDPAITCIGQPTDEIGTLAVKLLIRAVREPGAAPSHLHLPPSLIIRRSDKGMPYARTGIPHFSGSIHFRSIQYKIKRWPMPLTV